MMKYPLYLLAALALCACAGPRGNLNGQPYAGQPGGAIAVRPEAAAAVSYDPNTAQPMAASIGQPAPVYPPPR